MQPFVMACAGAIPIRVPPKTSANTVNSEVMNFGSFEAFALCIVAHFDQTDLLTMPVCSKKRMFGKPEDVKLGVLRRFRTPAQLNLAISRLR